MRHTPGPWNIHTNQPGRPSDMHITGDDLDFPDVCKVYLNSPESEANARLIAAAPELLEACQEALAKLESMAPNIVLDAKDTLTMAIQKATGGAR